MANFFDILMAAGPIAGQAAAGYATGQMQAEERKRKREQEDRKRWIEDARNELVLEQLRLANEGARRDLDAPPAGPTVTRRGLDASGVPVEVRGRLDEVQGVDLRPEPDAPDAPRPVSWQTVQTPDGYVQVNPQTGETRPLGLQAPPKDIGDGRVTVAEQKANILLARAEPGLATIERIIRERGGRPPALTNRLDNIPLIGRFFLDEEQQLFETSAEQVISALLRQESGAAIQAHEIRKLTRALVPEAGDQPATVQAKLDALRASVAALRQAAQTGDNSSVRAARERLEQVSGVQIGGGAAGAPADTPANPFR